MRNYDTPVRAIRHKVYVEVAKAGFESTDETLIHDIEAIPYNIVEEKPNTVKVFTENVPLPASGFVLQWASSPGKQSCPSDRRSGSQQHR